MKERWRLFFPKLRERIKNNLPRGKFHRFLFPFARKFSDLNSASYALYIYQCCHVTHSEPGLVQQPPLSLSFRRNNMQLKNSGHGTFQLSKISEKFILLRKEMAICYFNGIHRLLNRFISLLTVIKAMCSRCLEISSDTYLPTPRVNNVHYFLLAHELSAV